jgi:hypothetical protein
MMPTAAAAGMSGCPFLFQCGASLASSVENGASAVHLKPVVGRDVGQKLLADGTFQVDEVAAGDAFEVEVAGAVPLPHVLVDVGRLSIAAVFPHGSLSAQLGEVAVDRTLAAGRAVLLIHFGTKLLHRKLAVGVALQKVQQSLSSRCFIYTRHGIYLPSAQSLAVYKYTTNRMVCQVI